MYRRRLGLSIALLAFVVLIAVKPQTGTIRLSLDTPRDERPVAVEAGIELGRFAISILVREASRRQP
ncbi:hypothetical protein [Sphingomonas sp.]|uniref:hypothetical protein n=1 Tax=Sphingomonas sp. TaxID=28214 RepID=UPI002CE51894|nr:hypothetical protein [Sphingomonas sp.]HTG39523.1 hypothetical protein [Sphingomonas sp.]